MGRFKCIVGLILVSTFFTYSQSYINNDVHPYSSSLIGSIYGGVTIGKTDYREVRPGIDGALAATYCFSTSNSNLLGIRLMTELSSISGNDVLKRVPTLNGYRNVPESFKTEVISLNVSLLYSYAITQDLLPYVSLGLTYNFFNPKDENGKLLYNNANNNYDKKTLGFNPEFGVNVPINDLISLNINSAFHFLSTDYLDDVAFGKNKDFYATISLGVSYGFINNRDSDGDGIIDADDRCPEEPEDYDGFQDSDGCPDYDNDGDGIPDVKDKCPDEAEDFDGYQDDDGCPDLDNDGDGIPDIKDKCPDQAEDFDGFQDDDGCPDLDNDGDGIPDKLDKCPDQAETFNGFQDDDGCPDELPKSPLDKDIDKEGNSFILQADNIFYANRADIKPEAYKQLDEIISFLKKNTDAAWRIEGHMDSQGPEQWIRTMSSKRAEAVYYYFISHGLDASKFTIYGLGDKFPIANNATEEGRAKNRRIAIVKENK
jgi:outer membrane protein OmpA-like peptidoglycan-associated protein